MDVTVVDSDLPYPTNSGKRLRSLNLVLPLARRHRITYIARGGSDDERRVAAAFLRDSGITPVLVADPLAEKSGPAFYARLAANVFSTLPYSAAAHVSPAMRDAVQAHALSHAIDVLQLEHVNYMYCAEGLDCPVVLQAHNVESLIWKRLAETAANPATRAYFSLQHTRYCNFERRAYATANRVIAVSQADADLARALYQAPRMAVVDNGVDVAYFADVGRARGSKKVLFVGALDWRPNIDAVGVLLETILPQLRQRIPDAELLVVGRKPSRHLRDAIAASDGASLHADVPDVRPYMAEAAVMAVPLRIGGGSRLKILEALAAGLPVVSSTVGAEGLELEDGRHLAIADDWSRFAAGLADAIARPEAALERATHGRQAVANRYDWAMLSARLEQQWEAARASASGKGQAA